LRAPFPKADHAKKLPELREFSFRDDVVVIERKDDKSGWKGGAKLREAISALEGSTE